MRPDEEAADAADGETVGKSDADAGGRGEQPIERATEARVVTDGGVDAAIEGASVEQYAGIVGALEDGVYVLDEDGHFTFVNEAMVELTGYDETELRGEPVTRIKDRETGERTETALAALRDGETEDLDRTFGLSVQPKRGEPIACEEHVTALFDDGQFRGVVGIVRDISDRRRHRELISQLQETSRSLMQAPSRESVADIVANAARQVLGFELSAVRLYDADERVLRPTATTDATDDQLPERPVYALDEGQPGTVFASGEPAVYDDVRTIEDPDGEFGPVRSAMYFPIGVHGTLTVASTTVGAFDENDRQVAALLAINAAAACNRAKREQEVREARERIETILERINGLIQNTVEVLVEATTREQVEAGVCEQLVAVEPYTFAWLGRPDVRAETISAREWAGSQPSGAATASDGERDGPAGAPPIDVADVAEPIDGDTPGAQALESEGPKVLEGDALEDAGGWFRSAAENGVRSVMAIPLSYTDSNYGVLYVCADQTDAFDQREKVVLQALGRAVANAINAIESGRILSANKVIELEFTVDDRDLLLSRLSGRAGGTIASAGTVTQEDGSLRLYLTTQDADTDEVMAVLDADDAVESASRVAEHDDEALFDVTVTESLIATLVDHGAVPKSIVSENGIARYNIELPYEAEAREVFGLVEDNYDSTDLVGYHEHERPVQTQQEFRAALADRFTDRQETALRTAYLGGFFEWPREVDGDELAGGMDISRPTYHQHLRAAQHKVFEELFEGGY
ncbi:MULTISPECIES: bacterio-opsin activator domain-containing protein [Halomicrobium]|uniref:PAS domain S-box protein n=2 Tax=Halomicrobium mukohataei TaxID=57705 RepID=A0A4D6KJ68_9EURY|nr:MULTISPECIES: bacterio-opsin activator domain-containing protein [Halomicrobium]ACV46814.1 putative PAS/PAC sensor protein [Halomicrobium mukohataei DSM 12286]QCD65316.1 PAS domain S-box protein [Halomicrobium mukohataei]QFR20122.1 GAF domain-containing protein [Halomicrobium sp. ZPS1]